MKAKDLIALLEYGKAFDTKDKVRKNDYPIPDLDDIIANIEKKKRDVRLLEDWVKGQEKLNKPEEKKEDKGWSRLSFVQKVTVLTFTVPLVTMGWITIGIMFITLNANLLGFHK